MNKYDVYLKDGFKFEIKAEELYNNDTFIRFRTNGKTVAKFSTEFLIGWIKTTLESSNTNDDDNNKSRPEFLKG